jgi:penicillin-binding protein 2
MKELIKDYLEGLVRFVTHRLFILSVVMVLMFSLLINRLFTLQIIQGQGYLDEFTFRISKEREIGATRGNIYDRYGRPLAINELAYSVTLDDSYDVVDKNKMIHDLIRIIESNGDEISTSIPIAIDAYNEMSFTGSDTAIVRFKNDVFSPRNSLSDNQLNMDAKEMFEYLRNDLFKINKEEYTDEEALKIISIRFALHLKRYSKYQPEVIAVNINEKTLAGIRENSTEFPGVTIIQDPLRVYPDGEYFAHIIGYTGIIQSNQLKELKLHSEDYNANSIVGQIGIEKEMEIYLKGQDGAEKVFVNNLGKILEVTERVDPVPGKDIYLTIDKQLQIDTYNALENQLAIILADRLKTVKTSERTDLVVEDIFVALIENNKINLREIEANTDSQLKQNIHQAFLSKKETIVNQIDYQLSNDQPLRNLDKEIKSYTKYVYSSLESKGVLTLSSDDKKADSQYQAFQNESIGLRTFLKHAVNSDYINLKQIGLEKEYYDYEEVYEVLTRYILRELDRDNEFKRRIYYGLVENRTISARDWSLLLFELGILEQDEVAIQQLKANTIRPLDFIKEKILNLEIKPKDLALEPYQGSAVVTDVNTGEVLALVSYPSYDNNRLVNGVDSAYFNQLNNDAGKPMIHRALQQRTAPGSTFKMITAMAGLTEGVIRPGETIRSEGIFTKISPGVACWIYSQGGTHGNVDVVQALATSCNFFFSEVGFRLSMNESRRYVSALGTYQLTEYASMFGLDSKTGIELPEYMPQISNQDAVRSSIGQGEHNYTAAQLARYVSTIANGGIVNEFHIIDKIANPDKSVFLQKETTVEKTSYFNEQYLNIVRDGMYNVTYGPRGTARSVFAGFPITVVGKSGTAEESKNSLNHSLFVGYAPYENPEIGIAVTIPNGITGNNSARVLKEAVSSYFKLNQTNELINYENILQ